MKSFAEVLAEKRTMKLAEQTFILMCEAGIDPELFVAWLEDEGQYHANLNKSAQLWLEDASPYTPNSWYSKALAGAGGLLGKAAGWAGGAPARFAADTARGLAHGAAAGAHQAGMQLGRAADLAKNKTGVQPASKMFCKTGFYDVQSGQCTTQDGQPVDPNGNPLPQKQQQPQQTQQNPNQPPQVNPKVQNALKSLQNLSRYIKDQNVNMMLQNMISQLHGMLTAPPSATPVAPPAAPVESIYNPYLSIMETRFFDRKLERLCATLAHKGVNPVDFVDWYVTEGQYLQGDELNENFGDWVGRNFHGFTQAVSGLGDGRGFWNRWQQGSDGYMQDQTKKAIDSAIKSLKDLQSDPSFQDPNFKQNIEQIMSQLSGTTQQATEQPAESPQDNAAPTELPADDQTPQSSGIENDSTGPAVADATPPTDPAPEVTAPVDPSSVTAPAPAPTDNAQPAMQQEPSQQDIQTAAYYYKQNNPNVSDEEAWNMGRQQLMQVGGKAEWFKSLSPFGKRLVEDIEFHQSLRNMSKRSWLI